MAIDLFAYSDKGARDHNEDSFHLLKEDGRYIAIVCDGLGGHNCGEVASQAAVKNIVKGLTMIKTPEEGKIHEVLNLVNDGLQKMQEDEPRLKGMRTTAVGCVIQDDELRYFNCGDSRFYYFSNGKLLAMSKDHSVSQMSVELGEMTFDNIRFDDDRNKLLKVMGQESAGDCGTVYQPIKCKKGDAFLICSDGFWEYILEEEMEIDLSKSESTKDWIQFMLVRLMLKFSEKNDNFTVIGGIIK